MEKRPGSSLFLGERPVDRGPIQSTWSTGGWWRPILATLKWVWSMGPTGFWAVQNPDRNTKGGAKYVVTTIDGLGYHR